jgi:hypothetical protein
MPLPSAIKLFIDPKQGLAFGNFAGSSQISNPTFTLGDTAGIEIYLVENTQVANYPRQEINFPATPGIKVAIGAIDESPTAGTWLMSYGGDTTAALPFNATNVQLQTALNSLASITAAGGVTVSKIGDNYNIAFNTAGVRTELTTDGASLIPLSTAAVATLQAGTISKPQISLMHLQRTVAGLATTFTQTSASQITVESLGAWDGSKATFRVSISPDPKGGTFTLGFDAQTGDDVSTASINVGASALDVQNALNIKALLDKVAVTQVGAYAYDITVSTQPGTNGLTANAAGLLSFSGYKGDLSLNTAEAISLLDGANFVETTLEVEITSDSKTLTLLQIPCTLKNAVIDVGAVDPLVLDTYLSQATADGRYLRQSNNLSDLGSASTARTNLGVYSTSQVDTALALKASDADLDLKADLFEPVFSGKIQTPTIKNILNADLVIDSYNDTGAGTHYLHKFTPFDGKLVLATNGGGLTFPDGTTQSTAFTGSAGTAWGTITGNLSSQTDLSQILTAKANLAGATFTGKVNATSVSGAAGINIGIGGDSTTASTAGDLWIATGGANLNFRDGTGAWKVLASLQNGNTFNQPQAVDVSNTLPALRVTQRGTGEALRVEDSTTPDSTPFVINADGAVGIGAAPGAFKLNVAGNSNLNGNTTITGTASVSGNFTASTGIQVGLSGIQFQAAGQLRGVQVQPNINTQGHFDAGIYGSEVIFEFSPGQFYAVPARLITQ